MGPETLLIQMRSEVYVPHLQEHPLFKELIDMHQGTMLETCHFALSTHKLAKGDELFHFGMEAKGMIFIMHGGLGYVNGQHTAVSLLDCEPVQLKPGQWLCEPVLWTHWENRGQATAHEYCDVATLDSTKFRAPVAGHPAALHNLRKYARLWIARVMVTCRVQGIDFFNIDDILDQC